MFMTPDSTRLACEPISGTQACSPRRVQAERKGGISRIVVESMKSRAVRVRHFRPFWSPLLLDARTGHAAPAQSADAYSDNPVHARPAARCRHSTAARA